MDWLVPNTPPYQVSIQAIQAVPGVGVIVRLGLLVADIVHYLVFSLTRNLYANHWSYTPISHTTEQCLYMYMHITTQKPLLVNTQPGSNLIGTINRSYQLALVLLWVWCSYTYWTSRVTMIEFPWNDVIYPCSITLDLSTQSTLTMSTNRLSDYGLWKKYNCLTYNILQYTRKEAMLWNCARWHLAVTACTVYVAN